MCNVGCRVIVSLTLSGVGTFLVAWGSTALNIIVAERLTNRIREAYVAAVLRQVCFWDNLKYIVYIWVAAFMFVYVRAILYQVIYLCVLE